MQGTKENGTRNEQDLRVQIIKRMLHHLRSSMHQIGDRDIDLRTRIRSLCGVGLVEAIIVGEIVHSIWAVDLRYIVHRMHRMLGMLVRVFLAIMQSWIKNM